MKLIRIINASPRFIVLRDTAKIKLNPLEVAKKLGASHRINRPQVETRNV